MPPISVYSIAIELHTVAELSPLERDACILPVIPSVFKSYVSALVPCFTSRAFILPVTNRLHPHS